MTRKNTGRASLLLLVQLALGFGFATYNLVTVVMHSRGSDWLDPITAMHEEMKNGGGSGAKFHAVVTATDAAYSKWQCRIMYYWYKRMRDQAGSDMGGFTRILHSGKPDNLMEEIPSFVVDPLPEGLDKGYVVLNRPWALVQWLKKAEIEEEYILMAEPDHVFVNPMPNLARGDIPAASFYFYISPKSHEKTIRKFYPEEMGPVANVDPVGNSPVIIKKALMEKIAPTWMNVSLRMKEDPETDKEFDWILEMYAYAVASALHGVRHILRREIMLQPPWDVKVENRFLIHYTYWCDYNMKGQLTFGKIGEWRFDKRAFLRGPPPKNLTEPPPGVPDTVRTLVRMINEATANLPDWDVEWE